MKKMLVSRKMDGFQLFVDEMCLDVVIPNHIFEKYKTPKKFAKSDIFDCIIQIADCIDANRIYFEARDNALCGVCVLRPKKNAGLSWERWGPTSDSSSAKPV